jgi:hypothetical protein
LKKIDMQTQSVAQFNPKQFFSSTVPTPTGTQRLDTTVSAVAISNDIEGHLSVTTAEGDTITLTANLEYDYRAVNYASNIQTDDGQVALNAKTVEASLKRDFGVTVEGDLNEQELHDLEKLFQKVSSIFRKFIAGEDEQDLAKTATLAERFGNLESLSGLDLSVDVERTVTALVAQITSESTGQPVLPRPQEAPSQAAQSLPATPGGAPAAAAAIPQPSTGTTAPTQPTQATPVSDSSDGVRLSAPVSESPQSPSLIQQVLDSLKETRVDTHKVEKYVPSFLERLREDLLKELRNGKEETEHPDEAPANHTPPPSANYSVLLAYQAVSQTSISLSIHG